MKKQLLIQLSISLLIISIFFYLLYKVDDHVKIQLDDGSYVVSNHSLDMILSRIKGIAQKENEALQSELEKKFIEIERNSEKNIDEYLDWNYSMKGSITQSALLVAVMATKAQNNVFQFDEESMNVLEKEVQERIFKKELIDKYLEITQKIKDAEEKHISSFESQIKKEVKSESANLWGYISYYSNPNSSKISMEIKNKIDKFKININQQNQQKTALSLFSGGAGYLLKNHLSRYVKIFSKRLVIATAEKLAVNIGVKALATTAGGSAAVTALFTCGPVCGLAVGVGSFLFSEYMANQVDEHLNRQDLKASLMDIFKTIKIETIEQVVSQYRMLNQILFAENNIKLPQKNRIRMIDLLIEQSSK